MKRSRPPAATGPRRPGRGFSTTARRVVRWYAAAAAAAVAAAAVAALHHTAAAAAAAAPAATATCEDPGEPAAKKAGRGLVAASTAPRLQQGAAATEGESPYDSKSAFGFFDVGEHCTPSSLWDWEVDATSYELGCDEIEGLLESESRFVGQGSVRRVNLVEYEGRTVAVKEIRDQGNHRLHLRHRLEVVTMDVLRGNPNLVQLLGVCNTTVVTEAFPMDIQSAMKKHAGTLPLRSAVSMSLDGARGLQAMHEASIVHYDMKPAQMLVADDDDLGGGGGGGELRVKLNDFNYAFFMSSRPDGTPCPFSLKSDPQAGAWRTPEYRAHKPMTEKVDIYRMGMAFKKYLANGGVNFRGHNGGPSDTAEHRSYNTVVHDMIEEDAERRPSARQVVERLEAILQLLP